jgi:YgiT-type zinc finger domain-containing protein
MRADTVKTAIWREERLFVIEAIPALVCDACMEQFYDEDVTDALRRLMEEFSITQPQREVVVPIYSLEGRVVRRPPSTEEFSVDY